MAGGFVVTCSDHGAYVGVRFGCGTSEGTAWSGLHPNHLNGIPRTVHIPYLCSLPQESQKRVHQMVEGKGQEVPHASKVLWW